MANILFVTAYGSLFGRETPVHNRLVALGHTVTLHGQTAIVPADEAAYDLFVYASGSEGNGALRAAESRGFAKPHLVFDSQGIMQSLYMLTVVGGSNTDQVTAIVANAAHPTAAGLTGTVTVMANTTELGSQVHANDLPAGADVVLVHDADWRRAVAYESGAILTTGTAPARRMFFGFPWTNYMTADGLALFDASVAWSLGGSGTPGLPQVTINSITPLRADGPPIVHTARVEFSTHSEFDAYEIQRAPGLTPAEQDYTTIADDVTASPYDDVGRTAEASYTYRIRGIDNP